MEPCVGAIGGSNVSPLAALRSVLLREHDGEDLLALTAGATHGLEAHPAGHPLPARIPGPLLIKRLCHVGGIISPSNVWPFALLARRPKAGTSRRKTLAAACKVWQCLQRPQRRKPRPSQCSPCSSRRRS